MQLCATCAGCSTTIGIVKQCGLLGLGLRTVTQYFNWLNRLHYCVDGVFVNTIIFLHFGSLCQYTGTCEHMFGSMYSLCVQFTHVDILMDTSRWQNLRHADLRSCRKYNLLNCLLPLYLPCCTHTLHSHHGDKMTAAIGPIISVQPVLYAIQNPVCGITSAVDCAGTNPRPVFLNLRAFSLTTPEFNNNSHTWSDIL